MEMAPPPSLPSVRPRKRTDSESTVNSVQTSDETKTSRPGKVRRTEELNQNAILEGLARLEAMLNEMKRRMDNHDKAFQNVFERLERLELRANGQQ